MRDDFAVFILTHGRADNVITYNSLNKQGYTGKIYIVIDDEDEQEQKYRRNYGDMVLRFSKDEIQKTFDTMDTATDRRTIVYARNAVFDLAKSVGVRYFLELDDDYIDFEFRWAENGKLLVKKVDNLDVVFDQFINFLIKTDSDVVAMAQGGDFIGGAKGGTYKKKVLRKAMNTFFLDVEKPIKFIGRINEDVNTYTSLGNKGLKIFTITDVSIVQKQTQSNKGGMSDIYIENGTFMKSFYTVMVMPSCVKIGVMGGAT